MKTIIVSPLLNRLDNSRKTFTFFAEKKTLFEISDTKIFVFFSSYHIVSYFLPSYFTSEYLQK